LHFSRLARVTRELSSLGLVVSLMFSLLLKLIANHSTVYIINFDIRELTKLVILVKWLLQRIFVFVRIRITVFLFQLDLELILQFHIGFKDLFERGIRVFQIHVLDRLAQLFFPCLLIFFQVIIFLTFLLQVHFQVRVSFHIPFGEILLFNHQIFI
jgi:hypothetical protein